MDGQARDIKKLKSPAPKSLNQFPNTPGACLLRRGKDLFNIRNLQEGLGALFRENPSGGLGASEGPLLLPFPAGTLTRQDD